MSLSLREVAKVAGDPIESFEVLNAARRVTVERHYQMMTGRQVLNGRLVGLLARVLEELGWSADELLILGNDEVDIAVLVDRGLGLQPEDPFLPDGHLFTKDAVQVLWTLELAENQGNTAGQCVAKAEKCHYLLLAGI